MNKKIGIICSLDGFANSHKPRKIKEFLERNGYTVELINVNKITNIYWTSFLLTKIFIFPFLFITIIISFINRLLLTSITYKKNFYYYLLILQMKLRGSILNIFLLEKKYYAVIIKTSYDSYVLTKNLKNTIKIFDCPTPWSFELYDTGFLSKSNFNKFCLFEKNIYKQADHLSFHWPSYRKFVEKNQYKGENLFNLNSGCEPKPMTQLAKFKTPPKVIYIGHLAGEWINLPLLSKISKMYPYIDVYGGPEPNKTLQINYKGYLKDTSIMNQYQFGLITTSKDPLRSSGFSAKHPEYLSYGLPVLMPKWRQDNILDTSCIYYDEFDFLNKIQEFSNPTIWSKKQKECIKLSHELSWNNTLVPLLHILSKS